MIIQKITAQLSSAYAVIVVGALTVGQFSIAADTRVRVDVDNYSRAEADDTFESIYPKKTYAGIDELFASYSCDIQRTELNGEIDRNSLQEWKRFRIRILEGSKEKVNFGGKYVIIQWGCGTGCETGAVIDLSNGKIYDMPTSEWGLEYRSTSLLLVVNPPSEEAGGNERPDYAYPAYYYWEDGQFVLLYDTRNRNK